jgi:hypothetical protein
MLNRRIPDERAMEAMRGALDRVVVLGELRERSRLLGHELGGWLGHDDELISPCEGCGARLYTRLGPERIEDGEASASFARRTSSAILECLRERRAQPWGSR